MVDQLPGEAAVLYALYADSERFIKIGRRNNGIRAPDGFVGGLLNEGEILTGFVFDAMTFFEGKGLKAFDFFIDMFNYNWFV